jgi:hypothetical protein
MATRTPPPADSSGRGPFADGSLSTYKRLRPPPADWDWRRERDAVVERSSPLANAFPLGESADLEALAEDLVANGQRFPILRFQGQLVDGRRRELACRRAGLEPWCEDLDDLDEAAVAALVLSLNAHRRHNTRVDLALSAAHCVAAAEAGGVAPTRLASALGINRQAVYKAGLVLKHCPHLERDLRAYRLSLEQAYGQAREAARAHPTATDAAPPRHRGRPLTPIAPEQVPRRWRALWQAARRADPLAVAASLGTEDEAAAALQSGRSLREYLDIALPEIGRRWPGISAKSAENPRPLTR